MVTFQGRDEMSAKVANVIAIELGILIALLGWLAIARVPSVRSLSRMQAPARTDESFATVVPGLRSSPQNLYATNGVARGGGSAQPAEELSPEYVQELSTEPFASSDYAEDFVAETSPYYAPVEQVPAVSAPDCYVAPVAQYVEFVQPRQIIVISNPRSFGRPHRCPARFNGGGQTVANQRPNGGRVLPRSRGVTPPVRQKPGNAGSMGSRGGNRGPGHVANGRARGGPISVLQ